MQNVLLRSPISDAWTIQKLRNSYKKNYIPQTGIESYTDKIRRVGIMECIETENIDHSITYRLKGDTTYCVPINKVSMNLIY